MFNSTRSTCYILFKNIFINKKKYIPENHEKSTKKKNATQNENWMCSVCVKSYDSIKKNIKMEKYECSVLIV